MPPLLKKCHLILWRQGNHFPSPPTPDQNRQKRKYYQPNSLRCHVAREVITSPKPTRVSLLLKSLYEVFRLRPLDFFCLGGWVSSYRYPLDPLGGNAKLFGRLLDP